MSKTSSKVKDRYNLKAYDEIKIRVHKGKKEQIQAFASNLQQTTNGFIETAIEEYIKKKFPNCNYIFEKIDE